MELSSDAASIQGRTKSLNESRVHRHCHSFVDGMNCPEICVVPCPTLSNSNPTAGLTTRSPCPAFGTSTRRRCLRRGRGAKGRSTLHIQQALLQREDEGRVHSSARCSFANEIPLGVEPSDPPLDQRCDRGVGWPERLRLGDFQTCYAIRLV